jgi:hypothetical protein
MGKHKSGRIYPSAHQSVPQLGILAVIGNTASAVRGVDENGFETLG